MKKRVTNKQEYGYQTIGSLIQSLQDLVEGSRYLTMDSPIFISDYNMSQQKYEFSVLPSFSSLEHKAGVCLFHSLNEPMEEYEYSTKSHNLIIEVEPTVEGRNMTKFARWVKE